MYKDFNQKGNRRRDAIYNPIEEKWERRHNPLEDDGMASKIQDLFVFFTKIPDRLSHIQNPYKITDPKNETRIPKRNAEELSSKTLANSSLNTLKQITYKPLKKLQDIKKQQDLHDQSYTQASEEEYKKGKEQERLMLIKIAIAVILFLLASISRF